MYGQKTDKTLTRDLNELVAKNLLFELVREDGRPSRQYVPNSDIVLGFMPQASRARRADPILGE